MAWLSQLTFLSSSLPPYVTLPSSLRDNLLRQDPDLAGLISLLGCTFAAWVQDTQGRHLDHKDLATGASMVITAGTQAAIEIRLYEANVSAAALPPSHRETCGRFS